MLDEERTHITTESESSLPPAVDENKEKKIVGSATEGIVGAAASALMGVAALVIMLVFSMNFIAELFCMYGLILGVRAIGDYKVVVRLQTEKPIATLVLGIVGVLVNAVAVVMWLIWIVGYIVLVLLS